jgi:hypothetical protein
MAPAAAAAMTPIIERWPAAAYALAVRRAVSPGSGIPRLSSPTSRRTAK